MSDTCEFGGLKESLIRDRVVFGIQDSSVRERLLRDPQLTLQTMTEKVRSAEPTQAQLKQIQADQKITDGNESVHNIKSRSGKSWQKNQKPPNKVPTINCKLCG